MLRACKSSLPKRTAPVALARSFATSPARRAEITLEVDGKPVTIEQGSSLIQACEKAGASIPRFCYHDRLMIAGNCRMCLVEVSPGPPKPAASCAMPAMPGQKVKTDSPLVRKAREGVMEFLLANHPLDCPICDQGGQCDLQDQSMRYGSDRTRFHEITGKRAVEDKDLGPLVKTVMTRCIHCTRCIRFANEVAGAPEMGSTGRGNDMQIGTYLQKTLNTEMSGNVIDLCPVGALTSKPTAFKSRPWELKMTESIDVMDAVGSNITVKSRGTQVMGIEPRINDDINEEWIHDKTRFAFDGLKYQRLTTPLIRDGNTFAPATWPEALEFVANGLKSSGASGDQIQAMAGALADTESLVALKDLMNKLGSDNTVIDRPGGSQAPVHGVDVRSNYLFNSTLPGAETADVVLLVGTNPRHEAAILNTRFRKSYLHKGTEFGLIGENFESTFQYEQLGSGLDGIKNLTETAKGKTNSFVDKLNKAKRPLIIVGSSIAEHADGAAVYEALSKYVNANKSRFITPDWNGFNTLLRSASHAAAYDIGFAPSAKAAKTTPKFVYLLNADDFDPSAIPKDAFVVYQGHHGDLGAQYADVCLPGAAYTEKAVSWVNTEGRTQLGRAAVPPPGASREDWKIIRAVSEVVGQPLPFDDLTGLRERMWDVSPTLLRYDTVEAANPEIAEAGLQTMMKKRTQAQKASAANALKTGVWKKAIEDFYRTDVISRTSTTMAQSSKAFTHKQWTEQDADANLPIASFG